MIVIPMVFQIRFLTHRIVPGVGSDVTGLDELGG